MKKKLVKFYDNIYATNKNEYFMKYRDGRKISEAHELAIKWIRKNAKNAKKMLDFGCGEADFIATMGKIPTKIGIDFSEVALRNANRKYSGITLILGTDDKLCNYRNSLDLVVTFGTLEHTKSPADVFLELARCLNRGGALIVSCPSFLNVRGVIWITLTKLFGVPMSLSDRHFLTPSDFKSFAKIAKVNLVEMASVDFATAQGVDFKRDMKKRVTNALLDANLDNSRVKHLISWVEMNKEYFPVGPYSGAEMIYFFKKY